MYNWDHPDAFDNALMERCLRSLKPSTGHDQQSLLFKTMVIGEPKYRCCKNDFQNLALISDTVYSNQTPFQGHQGGPSHEDPQVRLQVQLQGSQQLHHN